MRNNNNNNNNNVTAIMAWRQAQAGAHRADPVDGAAAIHDAALAAEVTAIACRQILMAGAQATREHAPLRPLKVLSLLGA